MPLDSIKGLGGGIGDKVTAITANPSIIAFYIFISLFVIAALAACYFMYKRWNDIKYKALIRYDTQNGYRYKTDWIIKRKQGTGNEYYFLLKSKLQLWEIDLARVFFGSGKPLIDLYLDSNKNLHQTDFISKQPIYNEKGKVTGHTPLIKPAPALTQSIKQAYHDFIKGAYEKHKTVDKWVQYAPAFLLSAAIIGMIMIIVASKVA